MTELRQKQGQLNLFIQIVNWQRKLLVVVLSCLSIFLLLLDWSFVRYRLLDESVAPAFWGGQKVVTLRWAYTFTTPDRLDYVIFQQGTRFIPGRVLAVAGDKITLTGTSILVNDIPLPEINMQIIRESSVAKYVPEGFVCVYRGPVGPQSTITFVPVKNIEGKILGKWQVLII